MANPFKNGNPEEQEIVKTDDVGLTDAPKGRFLQGF